MGAVDDRIDTETREFIERWKWRIIVAVAAFFFWLILGTIVIERTNWYTSVDEIVIFFYIIIGLWSAFKVLTWRPKPIDKSRDLPKARGRHGK